MNATANIVLKSVFERDVDLVLVRCFYDNNSVARLFLDKDDEILEIHHSATELHGESDLQIIILRNGSRHAILIEDKIDAPAQPNQYDRYCERGERGISAGRWNGYSVFIAAPQKYLENDIEAFKYPNRISYEDILASLKSQNDVISISVLEMALNRSNGTLPTAADEAVTLFWEHYYEYHNKHFPQLTLHVHRGPKGPNAIWPEFKVHLPGAKILHKSAQGYIDLQFRGLGEKLLQLKQSLKPYIEKDMLLEKAGASAVVRIVVPIIDFSKPFEKYEKDIDSVFVAATRLTELAEILSLNNILESFY